jgi:hypothetical protein
MLSACAMALGMLVPCVSHRVISLMIHLCVAADRLVLGGRGEVDQIVERVRDGQLQHQHLHRTGKPSLAMILNRA